MSKKSKLSNLYSKPDFEREVEPLERRALGKEKYRSPARRDYARLIHSPAFRRLQGKTQLYPGIESDFFRNRLTHSLEVSQIAESLAFRLNETCSELKSSPISPEICRVAGLFHDLGHPPFGHNGEKALDKKMRNYGGFEGNAQTLRIITRLEKKAVIPEEWASYGGIDDDGNDLRKGLNLTYRVIASALKYDNQIPLQRETSAKLEKGYYACDSAIVNKLKLKVAPSYSSKQGKFKTIECSIMDLADDIGYSTYDIEDSFKAGFFTPLSLLSQGKEVYNNVAKAVNEAVNGRFKLNAEDVLETLIDIFENLLFHEDTGSPGVNIVLANMTSQELANNGFYRTSFTSDLISDFIAGVQFEYNEKIPPLSKAFFDDATLRKVEVLKRLTYEMMILSPKLKIIQYRGEKIVEEIFDSLVSKDGNTLLPDDFKMIHDRQRTIADKNRTICDFIAGMTDNYAIEFYGRLTSESPQTIFKPL